MILFIIRKIITPHIYTPSMETSRTFSNVLENFRKKRKNFVDNPIDHPTIHLYFGENKHAKSFD